MGVPALFRWLSKKYPKIIYPVVEEDEEKIEDSEGNHVSIPVDAARANPNGSEFDNLYLDMNGIVHPCTHPEGKPAPETEEEMMVEIFKYTERIFNMVRPRRLLFLAIDGVAPRAKMNQQRSRRFRSAQEAKEKAEARKEAVALWKAMGKELSEEEETKEAWDSNAITPGTPFMDLLASSLRYWIVRKINTDPGWKNIQVILSDASIPGEGEHKIMDFIRRQRVNRGYDPNTRHVIYGLDADLIMLSLATHELHFKVLREDVFFQSGSSTACRICGQEGHFAAQCTGVKAEVTKKVVPPEKKPFIFLDIDVLREYLEVELRVPQAPFPFNLEQAIDDWVLLIFFVGNDFLPHLPSLEIREGAIDTLLRIWKQELPRMGGYLTNHGQIELSRAQIILEGLAQREDGIFRRRRETEERQNQNAKRRKLQADVGPSVTLQLTAVPAAPSIPPVHPSLPRRPTYDFAASADSIGLGAPTTLESIQNTSTATQALAGSNHDIVANRRAIRLANLSAAEILKAELSRNSVKQSPPERDLSLPVKPSVAASTSLLPPSSTSVDAVRMSTHQSGASVHATGPNRSAIAAETSVLTSVVESKDEDTANESELDITQPDGVLSYSEIVTETLDRSSGPDEGQVIIGVKRKLDDTDDLDSEDQDAAPASNPYEMKVNPDGTVEQEDRVRLWEPGYRQRYYRQKFDVDASDEAFINDVTKSYVEGMAWVLQYYYQGTPSWQWYYPYHFAPFAANFKDVDKMDLKFTLGHPFKPFEQLMAVFPTASRKNIPTAFQPLMVNEDSPIIDFYPLTFEVDMNGKRMAWQGVALLPFINERRLLDAMDPEYPKLTSEEVRRNRWGNHLLFVSDQHKLYPFVESQYGKKRRSEPVAIPANFSDGLNGSILPNPDCLPGSTYESPLTTQGLPSITNDRSLSVLYFFPTQITPHRSVILPGAKRPNRALRNEDLDRLQYGRKNGPYNGGRDNVPVRGAEYQATHARTDYRDFRDSYNPHYRPPPPAPFPSGYGSYKPSVGYNESGAHGGSGPPYRNGRGNTPYAGGRYQRGGYGGYGGYSQGGYGGYGRAQASHHPYGYNPPPYGRGRGH